MNEFKVLADHLPQLAWVADPEGRCLWYNQRWYDYTGTTVEEMEGAGGHHVHHPDYIEAVMAFFKTHLASGEPWEDTFPLRARDGSYRWFLSRAHPIRDESGVIVRWVGTNTDVTEHRAMEQALRESETRARLAIEAAGLGTWRYDPATKRVLLDERMRMIWGQPADAEARSLPEIMERVHPDDREAVSRAVDIAFNPTASGRYEIEYRVVWPDGTERWIAVNGQVQFEGAGERRHPVAFVGTGRDITEQKTAERVLRESERRFRDLADAVPAMLWISNSDGSCTFLSQGWFNFTGQTEADGLGLGWLNALHPGDRDQVRAAFRAANEQQISFSLDLRLRRHDGTYRWVVGAARPRFADNGTFLGFAGSVFDITERKEAEQALRESESHFRRLAEAIPDIVYTRDEQARVDYLNGSWYAYTGFVRDSEADIDDAMHPDDAVRIGEGWAKAFAEGRPFEAELRLRRHDGEFRWFLTRVVPIYDATGDIVRWFGSSTDIHAQKALEAELEARVATRTAELARANLTLEMRNRELQDFAYVASHDLQEPLRKIRTFADLLAVDFGPGLVEEARHYLSRMQDAAGRMSSLINALLAFSRVSTRGEVFEPVNLDEAASGALSDLEISLQETGGSVELTPLPTVEADSTQMRQLLQNLIGNALKYRRDGVPPSVRVCGFVEADADWAGQTVCRIEVEDNGIGFEEKYLDRIFAPFQRLHGRGQYEGTGIGLAICRKIVERHGGTITARSAPGAGSTFIVTLPLKQPASEVA